MTDPPKFHGLISLTLSESKVIYEIMLRSESLQFAGDANDILSTDKIL